MQKYNKIVILTNLIAIFLGVSLTFGLRLVTEHHEVANHEVLATECQRSAAIPPNMPQIVTVRRAIL